MRLLLFVTAPILLRMPPYRQKLSKEIGRPESAGSGQFGTAGAKLAREGAPTCEAEMPVQSRSPWHPPTCPDGVAAGREIGRHGRHLIAPIRHPPEAAMKEAHHRRCGPRKGVEITDVAFGGAVLECAHHGRGGDL